MARGLPWMPTFVGMSGEKASFWSLGSGSVALCAFARNDRTERGIEISRGCSTRVPREGGGPVSAQSALGLRIRTVCGAWRPRA